MLIAFAGEHMVSWLSKQLAAAASVSMPAPVLDHIAAYWGTQGTQRAAPLSVPAADCCFPVTTLAGTGQPSYVDGPRSVACFHRPAGICIDRFGFLIVADSENAGVPTSAAALFLLGSHSLWWLRSRSCVRSPASDISVRVRDVVCR